jgi:hypothetical protein
VLLLGAVDLDLDGVSGRPDEAWERVRDQEEEGSDLHRVAHVGGEEAVERGGRAAGRERCEPVDDRGEEDRDPPEREPDEVREEQEEPEEDGEPGAAEVVGQMQADRPRLLGRRSGRERRVRVRIAIREKEEVGARLRGIAQAVGEEVSYSAGHTSSREAGEPGEHGDDEEGRAEAGPPPCAGVVAASPVDAAAPAAAPARRSDEHRREDQRRQGEEEADQGLPALLRGRRVDLDVDRIARLAGEPGIRIGGQEHVGVQVGREADVSAEEVVQARGRGALHEGDDPVHDRDQGREERPDDEPDVERDREEQTEEDGEPRALEIVGDDDADRVKAVPGPCLLGLHGRVVLHGSAHYGPGLRTGVDDARLVPVPSVHVTPAIRTWWAWRRERSGSDAC